MAGETGTAEAVRPWWGCVGGSPPQGWGSLTGRVSAGIHLGNYTTDISAMGVAAGRLDWAGLATCPDIPE